MKNPQIVFLVIVIAVSLVFGGYLLAPQNPSAQNASTDKNTAQGPKSDPALINNSDSPRIGKADAKAQIVVFSDFLCPYCKTAHQIISDVVGKYGDDVSVVQRNFIVHPESMILAQAAEAANQQGKYKEMNDALFSKTVEQTEDGVVAIAKELKLDVNKFKADLNSEKVKNQITKDNTDATDMNLSGTPSLFLNNKPVEDFNNLESQVKSILGK
jgi:protein-disulfide isomerase